MAILDPHAGFFDPVANNTVMQEVLLADAPLGREWCINTAAVDPFSASALVNSEDGYLYRWDFATNTFTERVQLTSGVEEAYTPTLVGPDGTVYAINAGILFAVGEAAAPKKRR